MLEIGTREKSQPAPAHVVFEALTQPSRGPIRQWLVLLPEEQWPEVLVAEEGRSVMWSSLWTWRPDARVRFDVEGSGGGSALRWTLLVEGPAPEPPRVRQMCKRLDRLINAELRSTFGG